MDVRVDAPAAELGPITGYTELTPRTPSQSPCCRQPRSGVISNDPTLRIAVRFLTGSEASAQPEIPIMKTDSGLKLNFGRKQLLLIIASIGTAMPVLYGQESSTAVTKSPAETTTVKLPVFDVVSVRQNKSGTDTFRLRSTPDGISVENSSLLMLIRQAY